MVTALVILGTSSALIGNALATSKALATLPVTLQFLATMTMAIPASMLMGRVGRKKGFLVGSALGLLGAAVAMLAIESHSFALFCLATLLIGSFSGFGNYFRFAAVDVVPEAQRSRAISLVLAGGVLAAIAGPNLATATRLWMPAKPFLGTMLVALQL